jgi:hypothetical protein
MKEFLLSVLIVITAVMVFVYLLGKPTTITQHVRSGQYATGQCYQLSVPDPFANPELIKRIINIRGNYHQYEYWLGIDMGYGGSNSEELIYLRSYREITCPKFWGIF